MKYKLCNVLYNMVVPYKIANAHYFTCEYTQVKTVDMKVRLFEPVQAMPVYHTNYRPADKWSAFRESAGQRTK